MTQEEKELLLQDLCARLPYGVTCQVTFDEEDVHIELLESVRPFMAFNQITTTGSVVSIDSVKPYLRPMLSTTEEEQVQYLQTCNGGNSSFQTIESYDWLNAHHFDYHGLIEKGLALPAPDGMYDIKY